MKRIIFVRENHPSILHQLNMDSAMERTTSLTLQTQFYIPLGAVVFHLPSVETAKVSVSLGSQTTHFKIIK